jgi:hypothetical protein
MALGSSYPGSIPEIGMAVRAWGRNTATTDQGDNEYERKNRPVGIAGQWTKTRGKPNELSPGKRKQKASYPFRCEAFIALELVGPYLGRCGNHHRRPSRVLAFPPSANA